MIEVPQAFVRSTVQREGEPGARWVEGLPALVAELLDRWGCLPDGDVVHGGVGIVVPVLRRLDRVPAVIKVSFPHPGNVHEPDAFTTWGGQGAVRLYERDDSRFAMLLERVRASSLAEVEDADEVAVVAGRISRKLAVPAPDCLPRMSDMADGWKRQLSADQAEFTHALRPRTVDVALDTVRELGRCRPDLLVHGDLHARNILRADREPWLAVDPKGWAGDPAYDGGTLLKPLIFGHVMRNGAVSDPDLRRVAHRVLDHFAEAAGLDRERTRRWAQFHLVQAAFHGRRHGFRVAREGPRLDLVTQFMDRLAEALTPCRHPSHPSRAPLDHRPSRGTDDCGPLWNHAGNRSFARGFPGVDREEAGGAMSSEDLTWFKSSYSDGEGEGGECLEVAHVWRKSTYSDGEGGECLEVAVCPRTVHVRDSKNPDGPRLSLAAGAWAEFLTHAVK